jgi:hypothetical protein
MVSDRERDHRARARQHHARIEALGLPPRHPGHVGRVSGRQPALERGRIERRRGCQPDQTEPRRAPGGTDRLGGKHGA